MMVEGLRHRPRGGSRSAISGPGELGRGPGCGGSTKRGPALMQPWRLGGRVNWAIVCPAKPC